MADDPKEKKVEVNPAAWIGIGVAVGAGLGVALGNIAVGAGAGVAIGVALFAAQTAKNQKK